MDAKEKIRLDFGDTTKPFTLEDLYNKEKIHDLIKTTVAKMGPEFSKDDKKEHGKLLVKIFEKGMTPKEAMGISDKEIARIYSYGFHLFSSGKYEEALDVFKMLVILEPFESGFTTALGVCHHRLKHYKYALDSYMLSALLKDNDPVPFMYAYDCYMNLDYKVAASVMLYNAIARAGDQPLYAKVKERAQMILEPLQQEIDKETPTEDAKKT